MTAKLIDGKKLADEILANIYTQVATMEHKPSLAAILVGDNEASKLYLRLKKEACEKVDITFHSYFLEANCSEDKIIEVISFLNDDPEITGILVQLPLPKQFDTNRIIHAISPDKDVDGFHPQTKFISPNVLGIIELIKSTGEDLKNNQITILSNSDKFAEPFKKLLADSKVTYLTPQAPSPKLKVQSQEADVLIVAIGKPNFIKQDMIKKDAILIDVGINKVNGKTIGDIDPACDKIASWRSPVPGGVGPMTVAMLLNNLIS
jgi:methylenetetrahydrofolate dehydrogenase (NADP+) / methenyltetrahydrofolate cyclohydrolase